MPSRNHPQPEDDLPAALADLIRCVYSPIGAHMGTLPPFDAARAAAEHFRNLRRRRRMLRWSATAAGIAACTTLAWVLNTGTPPSTPRHRTAAALRGDLNHDGAVNMLDALLLARAIEQGQAAPSCDFNADAILNQADVDRLAAVAVSVSGGTL